MDANEGEKSNKYDGEIDNRPDRENRPDTNQVNVDEDVLPTPIQKENEAAEWDFILSAIGISKQATDIGYDDMMHVKFSSAAQASRFYVLYSKKMGFSVRKGKSRKDASGDFRSHSWVCSCQGFREKKYFEMVGRVRQHRVLTRTGCKACFRVLNVRNTEEWVVREFVIAHNHRTAKPTEIHLLRSNRVVTNGVLETARSMQSIGIKTWQIVNYFVAQNGGHENIGFCVKDLRNKMGEDDGDLKDVDAARAIGYLQKNADSDPMFYAKYCVDHKQRLLSLLWADSKMRMDYESFGHCLAFDTTYKTNKFRKPLLVFVGVNNHYRTTVFGFAILLDETVETYRWALRTFLDCMRGVSPKTVITDGDLAMKKAIEDIFPQTVHRLCAWHLQKNGGTNVKNLEFVTRLKTLMFRYYDENRFNSEWEAMLDELDLSTNDWVASLYDRRHSWAETFLRGYYFGGMTTTQRNEGINSYLKTRLNQDSTLNDFVRHLERGVCVLRENNLKDEFDSNLSMPVTGLTNMPSVERQASEILTPRMFYKLREEILREGKYMLSSKINNGSITKLVFSKYGAEGQTRVVDYMEDDTKFKCQCQKFESVGIPCRHIFAAMKALNMMFIPNSLINTHWTKEATSGSKELGGLNKKLRKEDLIAVRFGQISSQASELAWFASRNNHMYGFTKQAFGDLFNKLREMWEDEKSKRCTDEHDMEELPSVKNPKHSATKGSASSPSGKTKKKKCGHCGVRGHNKQTCRIRRAEERVQQQADSPSYTPYYGDTESTFNGAKFVVDGGD